jgi:uncharacterized Tic20 family protein
LIVTTLKKDLDPFVNNQNGEALNFRSLQLAMIVCSLLAWMIYLSMLLVSISALVLTIIAGIKANAGKPIVTQFAGAVEVVLART